jgi:hypothetical protein
MCLTSPPVFWSLYTPNKNKQIMKTITLANIAGTSRQSPASARMVCMHEKQATPFPTSNGISHKQQTSQKDRQTVSKSTPLNMLKPAGKLGTYGAW